MSDDGLSTRTVAIIKHHALGHRFDIEPRILEAGFEIVKERQMEFDVETDPDTLYEIFGEDAVSLGEGPVWVYVLERRWAPEVWLKLMGDSDPDVARANAPSSMRALYGISAEQNGLMGSQDAEIAELQIASIFASSPPFPTSELPTTTTSDEGYAPSSNSASTKTAFRARALPATHLKPDIQPRMSKAAALRAGLPVEKTASGPRTPPSKEAIARTFANVPGHKRAGTITVASTAPPAIAPRMTRAAALRLGIDPPLPTIRRRPSTADGEIKSTFDGVPGHKRRESFAVASTQAPTVTPRLNKSSALRLQAQKDAPPPPSSFMFRTAFAGTKPGISRSASRASLNSRPSSAASLKPPTGARTVSLTPATPVKPPSKPAPNTISKAGSNAKKSTKPAEEPKPEVKPRQSVAPPPPTIAPRTNKSALLRAAKMAAATLGANVNTTKVPKAKRALAA